MVPPRRPDPEPLETDDVAVVTVGTVLWGIALVATAALGGRLGDGGRTSWVWISAAGFFLGLVGIRYVRRRRAALRAGSDQPGAGSAPHQT
jgi:hypothetical protein